MLGVSQVNTRLLMLPILHQVPESYRCSPASDTPFISLRQKWTDAADRW